MDTVDYDYVYFTRNSGLRPVIDSCFSKIKRQPTIAYEGEEDSSVAGLVAAGFGIAIVPKIPLLDTMDVCIRPIVSPEIERYIYLVLKKDKYLNQGDLATAANYVKGVEHEKDYVTISNYIKQLKKL